MSGDVAYTEPVLARRLVGLLADELRGKIVWEPHIGGASFALPLLELDVQLLATDTDADAPGLDMGLQPPNLSLRHDALGGLPVGWPRPQWVVGNPPWSNFTLHVEAALRVATHGVAFLGPLAWMAQESGLIVLQSSFFDNGFGVRPRPSFWTRQDPDRRTSAKSEVCWYVWRRFGQSWRGRGQYAILHRGGVSP